MTQSQPEITQEQLEAIAFVGNTLGPLFYHDPASGTTDALFEALGSINVTETAAAWPFAKEAESAEALGLIAASLREVQDDKTALAEEFRRLFVGPARKAAAPWGSVYTDRESVIFGKTCLDLRDWMGEHGIEAVVKEKHEPEDHIGLMLMLAAWIATNRPELTREYLGLHLLTWAPHFLELMQQEAKHPFYQGLAQLTRATLVGAQEELALDVTVPRFFR